MQQMYSCPNCGSLVEWGQKFCANCGSSFDWDSVQDASQSSYDYGQQDVQYDQQYDQQYYQQQDWNQQSDWNQYYTGQQNTWGNVPPAYPSHRGRVVRRVPRKKSSNNMLIYLAIFLGVVFVGSAVFLLLGGDILSGGNSSQDGQSVAVSEPAINFSAVPDSIQEGETADLSWDVSGATSISIDNGIGAVADSGLQTVSPSSTTTYTLNASNSIGTSTKSVTVTVAEAGVPRIVSFTSAESSVATGGSTTLQWEVQGADTVKLNGEDVSASGSKSIFPSTTTNYTLVATNSYGDSTKTTTVTMIASSIPQITSFSASPAGISSGGSSTLSWEVSGADTVEINQGVGSVSSTSGTKTVSPTATTTYTLTATNTAGSSTATAKVTIVTSSTAPVISSFTASPLCIVADSGDYAVLSWEISGATTIEIDDEEVTTDTYQVSPSVDTVYTLKATNSKGSVTKTVTVYVVEEGSPIINSFNSSLSNITSGQSITLSWNVSDADTVSISPNVGLVSATSGSVNLTPTSTTMYTLTATNDVDSVIAEVRVVVATGINFTASPSTITEGNSSTLTWSIIGASNVYLDPPGINVNSSGTETVYPTETTEYTITADSIVAHVTVTVVPAGAPTISSFTATYDSGDTYILSWTISGATSGSISPTVGSISNSLTTGSTSVTVTTTTTYTLTASNSVSDVTQSVTVTITE